jgi:4-hydroxybenzoate polyprenyltransferase
MNAYKALKASRPFLWVNTAVPFALGWLIMRPILDWRFSLTFLFFLFPYNLMMYGINDIFDYESDIKNPRKASIEGAALKKEELNRLWNYIIAFSLPFIVYLFVVGSLLSNVILAFSLFMVVAYSAAPFRFKEIPFLDSFTSSMHFFTPLAYGLASVGVTLSSPFANLTAVLCAYVLWGMASHAFGAVQDIQFDRDANIASVATSMGARTTVVFSTLLYVASALIIFISFRSIAGLIVASSIFLFALNSGRFWTITDSNAEQTRNGWRIFLVMSLAVGALVVTGFMYFYIPFGIARMPSFAPVFIAAFTFLFFWYVIARK